MKKKKEPTVLAQLIAQTDVNHELDNSCKKLLSTTLTIEQKQTILESRFGLSMTAEIKEDVNYMCNISKSIKIEALKEEFYKGMEQGINQGITQGMFRNCLSNLKNLMQNLSLTATQAMDALNIPQEERAQYLEYL